MSKKRYLFIINPISGGKKKVRISAILPPLTELEDSIAEFRFTRHQGHGYEIAKEEYQNFDVIVAVGGDGTVNEVSKALINTGKPLALIPRGSGNGLGLFLDIPFDPVKAIDLILKGKSKLIDTGMINDMHFVNVAGVGFDALISHRFATLPQRGLRTYATLCATEYFKYKAAEYQVEINGKNFTDKIFLLSFANSSQWGNNFHVASNAKIDDGKLDLTMIERFGPLDAVPMGLQMINGSLDKARNSISETFTSLTLTKPGEIIAHLDGEPVSFHDKIEVKVVPQSLRVIVP